MTHRPHRARPTPPATDAVGGTNRPVLRVQQAPNTRREGY